MLMRLFLDAAADDGADYVAFAADAPLLMMLITLMPADY